MTEDRPEEGLPSEILRTELVPSPIKVEIEKPGRSKFVLFAGSFIVIIALVVLAFF